jgi:hypothetical protein
VIASPCATGRVTTVLDSPTAGGSPLDGPGSTAVLSSGAWSLLCRPDGTALLLDRQQGAALHICPPGEALPKQNT